MKHIPNPGGKAAVTQGCKCPVFDNHHGEGVMMDGRQTFWISELCPLHGYAALTEGVDQETPGTLESKNSRIYKLGNEGFSQINQPT